MLAWKALARRYRYRYNRIVRLNKGAVADAIEALQQLSPFVDTIKGLLEIIGSDHIKHVEALARAHGYELDKATSKRYGEIVQRAKGLIHGCTAGRRKAPVDKRGVESGSGV